MLSRLLKKNAVKWIASITSSIWYRRGITSFLLVPLSYLFCGFAFFRRTAYRLGLLSICRPPVPLIVVGNITTGGSGKTPLIIWLSGFLKTNGLKPGIICGGYGGGSKEWPLVVSATTRPGVVGDEAFLLFRKSGCPVVAGPDRKRTVKTLVEAFEVDVILSDDGLQHYGLARDVEVAVIDGERRFGNGRLLPAGPLRENIKRLKEVDFVVTKGCPLKNEIEMSIEPKDLINVSDPADSMPLDSFRTIKVNAVCGIGHNESFFRILDEKNITYVPRPFPDHYQYSAEDLDFGDGLQVVMTEKDAVKCEEFATGRYWSLPIEIFLGDNFGDQILRKIVRKSE
ncbi:MAG: tetraacyldisaccharide 4'-kinase [Pseudomonadota bacterium]|nr:tetraacyldisaccharide 4'-kinase [Pseudomonadota bacterium]